MEGEPQMTEKVLVQRDGPVTTIVINRPEFHNCIDGETARGLLEAWLNFREDETQHVAILTGTAPSFSSGADLKALQTLGPRDQFDPDFVYQGNGYLGFTRLTNIFKPTIAAIQGYCLAGGLEMAAWCDIRVASPDASFGCPERRWNVPLVDGGTQRLSRILGWGRAMDLILSGRIINAQQALDWGLITQLTAPGQVLEEAQTLAAKIAAYPQGSLRSDKQAAARGWDLPLEEGLRVECQLGMPHTRSRETGEGLQRFQNRPKQTGDTL